MCIEIFGYKSEQTKDYAEALGNAVQLTNIVRDIAEDAKINRIYIPKEDMEKFGVTEEDILRQKETRKIRALLLFELERAQEYYDKARVLLTREDFKNMLSARAMGNIYEALLKKLQKIPCVLTGKKLKLSKIEKIWILLKTWREKL
jgi:phytoene synthase